MDQIVFRIWHKRRQCWLNDSQQQLTHAKFSDGAYRLNLDRSDAVEVVFATGFHAKDKREIFVGDLIENRHGVGVVEYKTRNNQQVVVRYKRRRLKLTTSVARSSKVIGTKFEMPIP